MAGLDVEADVDEVADYLAGITVQRDYAPYPNKLVCLVQS